MDHFMDPRDEMAPEQLELLASVFREQLTACLEECAGGRQGLFGENLSLGAETAWPEAEKLRELAMALQGLFAQQEKREALSDEFLDLCTMHGESNPGEKRLARVFLDRIEKGQVGTVTTEERKTW